MAYPEGLPLYTIWDDIAYLFDSTKDLLSLALTCRTFKELIIPDHLEYRYICCDLRRVDVWKFLSSRPRLAKGIRFFKLEYEPSDLARLPQALRTPDQTVRFDGVPTDEHLTFFKHSLSYMTCLKKFCWTQKYDSAEQLIDLSQVLTSTTKCLEALSVAFGLLRERIHDQLQLEKLSIWNLTGLKQVIIYQAGSAAVRMILHSCPDIEELYLPGLPLVLVPDLFRYGNWRNLRRLSLDTPTGRGQDNNIDISGTMIPFLDRHDNLETLFLEFFDVLAPDLPSSRLPKLRSLHWSSFIPDFVVTSYFSNDILSRLVHWLCPLHNIDASTLPKMDNLQSLFLTLFVHAEPEVFVFPLLLKAPNLEKICLRIGDLDFWGWRNEAEDVGDCTTRQERFIKAFMNCPKLTHIFCDLTVPKKYRNRKNLHEGLDPLCKRLSLLPALKYFRLDIGSEKLIVKMQRDGDGLYSEYQFVTLEEGGGEPIYWANYLFDF